MKKETKASIREMFRTHLASITPTASNPTALEVGYAVLETFCEVKEFGMPEETEGRNPVDDHAVYGSDDD